MFDIVVNGSRNNTLKTFPEAYRYVKAMLGEEAAVPSGSLYGWDPIQERGYRDHTDPTLVFPFER